MQEPNYRELIDRIGKAADDNPHRPSSVLLRDAWNALRTAVAMKEACEAANGMFVRAEEAWRKSVELRGPAIVWPKVLESLDNSADTMRANANRIPAGSNDPLKLPMATASWVLDGMAAALRAGLGEPGAPTVG